MFAPLQIRAWPRRFAALLSITAFALSACAGDSAGPDTSVATVQVTPGGSLNAIGATVQLTASPKTASGTAATAGATTWSSSNAAVATVSPDGLVTAAGNGDATITATIGGVAGTSSVTVAQVAAAVAVSPGTGSLAAIGATQQLSGDVKDANNHAMSGAVTWTTSNAAVATVSASGLVTAVANGTVTITGASGAASGMSSVMVAQVAASARVILPRATLIFAYDTTRATAKLVDANGHDMAGGTWSWTSGNTNYATIASSGLITAWFGGPVTITATDAGTGKTATAALLVSFQIAAGDVRVGHIAQSGWTQPWTLDVTGMTDLMMWSLPSTSNNNLGDHLFGYITTCYDAKEGGYVGVGSTRGGQVLAASPFRYCGTQATPTFGAAPGETGDYVVGFSQCWAITWAVNFIAAMDNNACLISNGGNNSGAPVMTRAGLVRVNNLQAGTAYTVDYWQTTDGSGGNLDPVLYVFGPPRPGPDEFYFNDDFNGSNHDAEITFTPAITGAYTFLLTTYGPNQIGNFVFAISPSPAPGSLATRAALVPGDLPRLAPTGPVTPAESTLAGLRAAGLVPATTRAKP